jgi:hypothetical protein
MPGEFIARQGLISRGNVVVTGSLTTSGSLTTTGTITATTLVVQTITSSISSITGSTNFGSLVTDTHKFTGSINASGSGTFTGALSGTSATLSSSLTIGSTFNINTEAWVQFLGNNVLLADGDFTILQTSGTGLMRFRNNSAQNLLTLANNGAATFSSSITAGGRYFATTSVNDNILEVINTDTTNGYGLFVRGGGTASGRYVARFKNAADSDVMWIGNTGNVGMGTTTPSSVKPTTTFGWASNLPSRAIEIAPAGSAASGANAGLFLRSSDAANGFDLWADNFFGDGYLDVRGDAGFIFRARTNGTAVERMRITSAGLMLLGATSSYTDYAVIQITADNKGIGIRDSDGAYRAIYNQSGTLYFWNGSNEGYLSSAGAWVNASDISIKKDVKDLQYGLKEVLNLKPKSYKMIDNDLAQIGFIAQEVEEILPELVDESKKGMKGLSYSQMTAVLVKAIQELTARVQELENK